MHKRLPSRRSLRPARSRLRGGYALVLVLLLLVIAGAALAAAARLSLGQALVALRAEEDLQRRWAELSCRGVLLPRAETILRRAEAQSPTALASVRGQVTLSGRGHDLVLWDEQAKLNLRKVLEERGPVVAEQAALTLTQGSGRSALASGAPVRVRLAPLLAVSRAAAESGLPALGGLGEVFADPAPAALLGASGAGAERSPLSRLTLWGGGLVNFRRATPEVLTLACAGVLEAGEVAQLAALREQYPGAGLDRLVELMEFPAPGTAAPRGDDEALRQLRGRKLAELERRLTGGSTCHALWISARGRAGRSVGAPDAPEGSGATGGERPDRTDHTLAVLDRGAGNQPQAIVVTW